MKIKTVHCDVCKVLLDFNSEFKLSIDFGRENAPNTFIIRKRNIFDICGDCLSKVETPLRTTVESLESIGLKL